MGYVSDGVCLFCKQSPSEEEILDCGTCGTSWHYACLSVPPSSLSSLSSLSALPDWQCPYCFQPDSGDRPPAGVIGSPLKLIALMRAVEADESLTDTEKARRRQALLSGGASTSASAGDDVAAGEKPKSRKKKLLELLDESFVCSICLKLLELPVTLVFCGICLWRIWAVAGHGRQHCDLAVFIVEIICRLRLSVFWTVLGCDLHDVAYLDCSISAIMQKSWMEIVGNTLSQSLSNLYRLSNELTPCGHNFCLKCFRGSITKGNGNRANCRSPIPSQIASQPRNNTVLVSSIRVARTAKTVTSGAESSEKAVHFIQNQDRPDKAFRTERAQRAGKANACSGKIFVTVPPDHFGPILAENDPIRNQGVLVGESWEDRMECRQWGVHRPHVAGIAGKSKYGAQSVALSGGYQDDEDHGEWFLYTGSGGRDLSGNKRTNKEQSSDQQFKEKNEALRVSCTKGYPVRVVRSHKEKRSSYAPETGVRYDGIYRIEKCWRKVGLQGFKVCRYPFVRCDNAPAPWKSDKNGALSFSDSHLNGSDEHGDRPRTLRDVEELKDAIDFTERKESPAWDYDEMDGWRWVKPPPPSHEDRDRAREAKRRAKNVSAREKLSKELSCLLCKKLMNHPVTTPCAHNFCKQCLEDAFVGRTHVRERNHSGGMGLRVKINVIKCPSCSYNISDFLENPQVNGGLMEVIEKLKQQTEESAESSEDEITESSEDEINGTEGKPDPVDKETIAGPRMLETSNEVIQTAKIAANDSEHSSTPKQSGVILGSESNTQNTKTPQSFIEDNQISGAGSKQSMTCKRKKSKEKKVADSKESRRPLTRSCSAKMSLEQAIKNKESPDVESKRSDSPGSADAEMLSGGDNDQQTPKSKAKQPNTFVRERPVTRSCTAKAKEKNS
ncbi:hypothetical protein ACLOJK_002251 [Asimina triloba]